MAATPGKVYVPFQEKDPEDLINTPKQIRNRLRRYSRLNAKNPSKKLQDKIHAEMAKLYNKPIEEWDAAELAFGRPRDENGEFKGRAPMWVTAQVQQEAKRRLMSHTFSNVAGEIDSAIGVIHNIMTDTSVDDKGRPVVDAKTKLTAATFIIEHILGKPKAVVEGLGDSFTKAAIAAAIVLDDGQPQDHLILEGTVVEDDEEEAGGPDHD